MTAGANLKAIAVLGRLEQVEHSGEACHAVFGHEMPGSWPDLQLCVEPLGELIRGCWRHERIRIRPEYCPLTDTPGHAFNVNVCCKKAIQLRQRFQWLSEAGHQYKTAQLPWLRQRREYSQCSNHAKGMCHHRRSPIGHPKGGTDSALPRCRIRSVRGGQGNNSDADAFSSEYTFKPRKPISIGRCFVPVDNNDALDLVHKQ